jgi:hypothetical protein
MEFGDLSFYPIPQMPNPTLNRPIPAVLKQLSLRRQTPPNRLGEQDFSDPKPTSTGRVPELA